MRWLIFGDVHGNLPALELLLEKEKHNYDILACHGDLVNYGPWSNECVQLLSDFNNTVLLRGNHEIYFLEGNYPGTHPIAKAFFEYCYPNFIEFELISKYKTSHKIGKYYIQHTILDKYIFLDTPLAPELMTKNYIIGHSHQQYQRAVENYWLINTGSLGQNRSFINVANYLIYDDESDEIQLKNFICDIDIVINKMQSVGYNEICLNYYLDKKRF